MLRDCAKSGTAFKKLLAVYENREEALKKYVSEGKKVIGTLGADVPYELVKAAGFETVPVLAREGADLPFADKYLEYAFDPMVRSQFDRVIGGEYNDLSGLVISNSTDVLIRIYLYFREMKRMEKEVVFPDVSFMDWLFTKNPVFDRHNGLVIELFKKELEAFGGVPVTDEAVKKAAGINNENKQALRALDALRTNEKMQLTGTEMLIAVIAGFFMDKEEHTALIRELTEEAKTWPEVKGTRLYYTGSVQMDTALYEMIEENGYNIVGEDHDFGGRVFDRDFDMSLPVKDALIDCYVNREFSSKKAFVSQRVEALDRLTEKAKAETVLFFTHVYEEAASWDYPSQKKSLEGRGLKTVELSKMHYPMEPEEEARFLELLSKGKEEA